MLIYAGSVATFYVKMDVRLIYPKRSQNIQMQIQIQGTGSRSGNGSDA
jgi:hypothetical protein